MASSASPRLCWVCAHSSGTRSRVYSAERRAIGRDRLLKPRRAALVRAERDQRIAEIVLSRRPLDRNQLLGPFLQRRAIGGDRLLKPRRSGLPLPERPQRIAEIVLGLRPVERNPVAPPLLQRRTKGRDRLLEPRRPALPRAERFERRAEIVLRLRPIERSAFACSLLQRRAIGRERLLEPRRPALPLAEPEQRIAEIVLSRRPVERAFRARQEGDDLLAAIDSGGQGAVVAGCLAFLGESVGLLPETADPVIRDRAAVPSAPIALQGKDMTQSRPQSGNGDDNSRAQPGDAFAGLFRTKERPKSGHARSLHGGIRFAGSVNAIAQAAASAQCGDRKPHSSAMIRSTM